MIKLFKQIVLNYRVKRAIKMAKELSEASKRKYIVLMVAGVPKIYSKQELKDLIARRVFKKGTTIQDLEKRAIIITGPNALPEISDCAMYRGNSTEIQRIL